MSFNPTIPLPKLPAIPWLKVLFWAGIIAFALFVWPTMYKEYKQGSGSYSSIVRVNRFTGHTQCLTGDGWR